MAGDARLTEGGEGPAPRLHRSLLVAATLLVMCGVIFSLERLRHYVTDQHQVAVRLAQMASVSNRLSAVEWQAIGLGRVTPQLAARHQQGLAQLGQLSRGLAGRPDTQTLGAVVSHQQRYTSAVMSEFGALQRGDLALARQIDQRQVDPSFSRLTVSLEHAASQLNRDAQVAERVGQLTSVAVVLLAAVLLTALMRAFGRLSRQARQALAEQRRLEVQEQRDSLTGLLNRSGLARVYSALPAGQPISAVMIDLNDLKTTNDMNGHSAGDALLRRVALALRRTLPPDAVVARWGGDEFLVLLPGQDQRQAAAAVSAVRRQLGHNRHGASHFSYGVCEARTGEPLERPLAVADAAMYDDKERIRSSVTVVHPVGVSSVEEFVARLAALNSEREILTVALPMARALLGFDVLLYAERSETSAPLTGAGPGETGRSYRICAFDSGTVQLSPELMQGQAGPFAGGVIAAALHSGRTSWSNDYAADPRALGHLGEFQIKSCGASPVCVRGQARGAVVIGHLRTWRPITPQVRRVLESLARHLADVQDRQRMVTELQQALEGGQRALGIALELRDLETAGHTERVVGLAARLGRALGLCPELQQLLRQGAYLHDLGKLTVPDAVLLKPGRFTPDERALMETHAQRGFEIASQIAGLPQGTLEVIRCHHEKWDGSGYPDRLAGEAIPLLARIFAVCDVYDALTSARPYKPAWAHDEALAELSAQAGRHFDPSVVRAFLGLPAEPPPGDGTGLRSEQVLVKI